MMKYLNTYKIFENSNNDLIKDSINDLLQEIIDQNQNIEIYISIVGKHIYVKLTDSKNQIDLNLNDEILEFIDRLEDYLKEYKYLNYAFMCETIVNRVNDESASNIDWLRSFHKKQELSRYIDDMNIHHIKELFRREICYKSITIIAIQ